MTDIVETNITDRDKLVRIILEQFNIRFVRNSEDFSKEFEMGIWFSGEEGDQKIDDNSIFCVHSHSELYTHGVHQVFRKFIDQNGWTIEWYDMGTIFAWPKKWKKGDQL